MKNAVQRFHTLIFDFDGVFTDNKVYVDHSGVESVRCDRADSLGLDLLRSFTKREGWKLDTFILTRETNPVVLARSKKLNLKCYTSITDKSSFVKRYLSDKFMEPNAAESGLIYLGNDLNDLEVMCFAGLAVAPNDSHPAILSVADIVIDKKGGDGFIRAFIEDLIEIEKMGQDEIIDLLNKG